MNTTNTQDRYEITDDGAVLEIKHPNSRGMITAQLFAGAIRQQARDLEQLRADLAAAVAERDELRDAIESRPLGYLASIETLRTCFAKACAKRAMAELRAEQAESRLAAIDNAPTVAVVSECAAGLYVHQKLFGAQLAEPSAELIYRPTKDQA